MWANAGQKLCTRRQLQMGTHALPRSVTGTQQGHQMHLVIGHCLSQEMGQGMAVATAAALTVLCVLLCMLWPTTMTSSTLCSASCNQSCSPDLLPVQQSAWTCVIGSHVPCPLLHMYYCDLSCDSCVSYHP